MGEKNIVVIGKEFPPMKTLVLLGLAIVVGYLMAIVYFTITDAFGEKSPARPPQYELPQYYQYSQMFQPQFFQQPGYYPDQFGGPPQEFPPQFVQAGDPRQSPPPYYPPHPRQYPGGRAQQPEVNIYQNTDQKQAKPKVGQWGAWATWSACSQSCKGGVRSRSRSCSGLTCKGNGKETSKCNEVCCPVRGGWSEWSLWSTIPGDAQSRHRVCNNPSPTCGGNKCVGETTQTKSAIAS